MVSCLLAQLRRTEEAVFHGLSMSKMGIITFKKWKAS